MWPVLVAVSSWPNASAGAQATIASHTASPIRATRTTTPLVRPPDARADSVTRATGPAVGRQIDVVVAQDLVLSDVAPQAASLHQTLGEIAALAHLVGVHRLAVRHEHPVIVENLARAQIPLRDSADLHDWAAEGARNVVA